jgi:hypothetical protein
MFIPVVLASVISKWFLLLFIPFLLIIGKLEERFVLGEAPPMPDLPWSNDAEGRIIQNRKDNVKK